MSGSKVPFKYIPPDVAGLAAIPSFGIGALVAGVIVTFGLLGLSGLANPPRCAHVPCYPANYCHWFACMLHAFRVKMVECNEARVKMVGPGRRAIYFMCFF